LFILLNDEVEAVRKESEAPFFQDASGLSNIAYPDNKDGPPRHPEDAERGIAASHFTSKTRNKISK
jgi:hypothetical protein